MRIASGVTLGEGGGGEAVKYSGRKDPDKFQCHVSSPGEFPSRRRDFISLDAFLARPKIRANQPANGSFANRKLQ